MSALSHAEIGPKIPGASRKRRPRDSRGCRAHDFRCLPHDADADGGGQALPFDPVVPNEETIEAIRAARRGDLVTVGGVQDLLADLHADD